MEASGFHHATLVIQTKQSEVTHHMEKDICLKCPTGRNYSSDLALIYQIQRNGTSCCGGLCLIMQGEPEEDVRAGADKNKVVCRLPKRGDVEAL